MERRQRNASVIERHGELTDQQITQTARVPGRLAQVSATCSRACVEFVNRDLSAAIDIRTRTALKTRPEKLTQSKLVGQHLRLEVCKEKMEPLAGGLF